MLGGVDFGARRDVTGVARQLAMQGVPHEVLSAEEAEQRWPGMRFAGNVLYHPQAGTVDAALAVEAFISEARRHGAQVLYESEVVRVLPGEARAEIQLGNGERISARSVVAAAGAWVEVLLRGLVRLPPLAVTQQQIFHFPRLDPDAEPWPSVIHEATEPIYHLAGGRDGGSADDRKIAEHRFGTPTSAAQRSGRG